MHITASAPGTPHGNGQNEVISSTQEHLILRENKKNRKIFAKMFGVSKKVVFLHPQIERLNAIKRGISSVG